jgi:hypothetical protein
MLRPFIKPYIFLLLNSSLYAEGTLAGTTINNSSTINYLLGSKSYSHEQNSTTFKVVQFSNLHTISLTDTPVLANLGKKGHLPFQITNMGNGVDHFKLQTLNINQTDDFDVSFGQVYINYIGDNNKTMIPFSPSKPIILEAGASIKVIIDNTMPSKVALNTKSQVKLLANSQVLTKLVDSTSAIGEYEITGASQDAIVLSKTSEVKIVEAGQLVSFLIAINIQKSITNVILQNPIEADGLYVSGSLRVDGTSKTVENDGDMASIVNDILTVKLDSSKVGEIYYVTYDLLIAKEEIIEPPEIEEKNKTLK